MAIMVIVTGCTNFGADMKAEKMKICKETFLTDNKVSEKAFLTVGQILEETYIIEVVMYHYGNIYVEYPKIHCLKDKEREKKINSLIENHIFLEIVKEDDQGRLNELNMELECRITLQSRELLSFCYVGTVRIDDYSKPFDEFYSMTVDIKNVKELKLSDFVEIDENLVERIKKSTDISNQGLEENEDNEVLRESLLYQVKNIDTDFFIKTRKEGLYGFVLEPEALVVEERVYYAAGRYVLIRLPGQIIDNHFIFDKS